MKVLLFIFLTTVFNSQGVIYPSLPSHLIQCYRRDGPVLTAPNRLDVFVSTLRTLEANSQLDLRLFSSTLLRSLRLDGVVQAANPIETDNVTPYHASAFQFHKFKLFMDLFLPNQNFYFIDDVESSLSEDEICTLHRMISSSIDPWERGDEQAICPRFVQQNLRNASRSREYSRCPIERGVIQTKWGTIAPGTIIAGIAAALESQNVLITDILKAGEFIDNQRETLSNPTDYDDIEQLDQTPITPRIANADISNIWVATLAGDLAEVAVNQGPRLTAADPRLVIGSDNRWNDTILPRDFYLILKNESLRNWHMTDAEILAGIDALVIATNLPAWVRERPTLKLFQIIEMYYSDEGVSFDRNVRACNRQALFSKIFDSGEFLKQVSNFAQILTRSQSSVFIPEETMDKICRDAVSEFTNYLPSLFTRYHRDCSELKDSQTMDLIVATDGAWKGYDVEQFISWVGEATDVGMSGGSLGVLQGNTGNWIAPLSLTLTTLFRNIQNSTDEWPNRINMQNILTAVLDHAYSKAVQSGLNSATVTLSSVVLVISPSDRLSDGDIERVREIMQTLQRTYFDVHFAYVAQDLTQYQNINNHFMDYSEIFVQVSSVAVQDVINAVESEMMKLQIPKNIVGAICPYVNTTYTQVAYEDFVLPKRNNIYRIHPFYIQQVPLVSIQIRNGVYGDLMVCWWRGGASDSRECSQLNERGLHIVNITAPCPTNDFCPPVYISVTATDSRNICANNDCRVPHEVIYYIEQNGLRCLPLHDSGVASVPNITLLIALIAIITFSLIINISL